MAEGLFLEFSTSEINTIISKAKTLLTEGKTLMAYGVECHETVYSAH